MRNTYAYQHLFSSSHVPEDCPSALQPAEQAQSPKVHRKPASVVMRKLRAMMVNKKSFIMDRDFDNNCWSRTRRSCNWFIVSYYNWALHHIGHPYCAVRFLHLLLIICNYTETGRKFWKSGGSSSNILIQQVLLIILYKYCPLYPPDSGLSSKKLMSYLNASFLHWNSCLTTSSLSISSTSKWTSL